jgi:centromere/kinetochore protein ZW10
MDKENTSVDNSTHNVTMSASNDQDFEDNNGIIDRKQRDKLFRQTCVFIDMVPLFRDMADKSMSRMIQLQCQQITELVGERIALFGYALKSNEIVVEWSDATEIAYHAGLYHLRHVYQNWLPPILSDDVFNRVIGGLIDVFLTLYLDQIAKATDISSVACPYLHTFFAKVMYDLDRLWQTCPNTNQRKQYYSRVWDKFSVIGQFMNMSMSEIQQGLSNGMFRTVTGPELTKLISSCFDDTPKRQALLHLISSNQ